MLSAWRLKDFDVGGGLAGGAADAAVDLTDWISVDVPGDTYLALHAAGRLPDPFEGQNESACAWVADREWWWRTSFTAEKPGADERLRLSFLGLDTFASVWLNGALLGRSENMFHPAMFEIGGLVRADGLNTLAVCFTPTAIAMADGKRPAWGPDSLKQSKGNLIRKAQFGWGWDWGPHLPTVGIWRPVEVKLERAAALQAVKFTTLSISPARDEARVSIEVEADVFAAPDQPVQVAITLAGPDGRLLASETRPLSGGGDRRRASVEVAIVRPDLWWTPDLGEPALHALKVTLHVDGAIVDKRNLHVGVRTIALDTSPDPGEPGADFFHFVLNGAPIFARGVCWIPASSFVGAVDEDRYRPLLKAAVEANMNMVRIWGGGVYEHDAFYDLCDRLGLLVWQDFMFACAPYPDDDPAFVDNVTAEIRYQVARLRHHPSLAAWCGNNECQMIQSFVNAVTKTTGVTPGALFYDQIMPDLVRELDPTTPYWPGSPTGGANPNSMRVGDVHDWTVWHGLPPVPDDRPVGRLDLSPAGVAHTRYAEDMGRFISEYGIQASPSLETLRRSLPADQLALGSPGLIHRIKDRPKNKIDAMMAPLTGLPATLEDYVDFTQITQAEGLKFGIEHFRRRKPHCSGSLIWQFNDCWPGVSWSLVDYHGFEKAGYFYTRRAYAPVMASFKVLEDGSAELWITNDTLRDVKTEVAIEFARFDGGVEWTETLPVGVAPNSSGPVWRALADKAPASRDRFLHVRTRDGAFPGNRHFFAAIKDLALQPGALPSFEIERRGPRELAVRLTAPTYLYFVHLLVPFEGTRFSDNYFDLRAGESRVITVRNEHRDLAPHDVTVRCRQQFTADATAPNLEG